ncbi:hypothetical protein EW026_g4001 [Hermanssonia centrifuga]|uniref:Major facilitator superfamily (MFS) profile domain-containing protein n=1 Tax=Hermanssonia centrifuga TaxID=98765 RepID=A0A4S4KJT3_9APHY|nr:hypothetical protein EW026_g4001 [Hermanssonia centrifuga]
MSDEEKMHEQGTLTRTMSKETSVDVVVSDSPAAIQYPEGGLRAWLTVLGGFMVMFCTFGAVQAFGVYQDYYTRISLNDHPPSDASWIGSLQTFLLFAVGWPAGSLYDNGYFHWLLGCGSIIYLFSLFMLSLVQPHHYYQNILAQGLGIGLGMGLIFLPSLSLASHYFKARRTAAMGLMLSGSSIGGVIYPIMQNHIFAGPGGFPWGVRAAGFTCLFMLICANLVMKPRLPNKRQQKNPYVVNTWSIFTDVPYLFCIFGSFFSFWGLFVPFFYLQLFATKHGVPSSLAIYAISILNAAGLFGRTIPNILADHWGPFNVMIPVTAISGCLIFAMFGATNEIGLVLFAIVYGFFSGGFVSIIAPASATFSKDVGEVGTRIGIMCFVSGFALLTGNPIAGVLLDPPNYVWRRPIIFAGVTVLFGSFLLTVSRHMQAKRKNTSRL